MPKRGTRRVTAIIVLVGLGILAWGLATPERRRARAVEKVELGFSAEQVTGQLGEPGVVCPVGGLEHLQERFPTGTPPATAEQALARMQQETAERWVYPLETEAGTKVGCTPRPGDTEIGLDRNRRVLWYVPVTGRRPVVAPDRILPAGSSGAS
jgi:hypothetical protein